MTPSPIRVAVLPDQDPSTLRSLYSPLLAYLEHQTSLDFELMIPADYADLVDQFDAGRLDMGWFGGLTFAQSAHSSGAVPLVFRDVDTQFVSCLIVNGSDNRKKIDEFAGEHFSFGPELSTSGHLMPRFFFKKQDLYPEQFFASVRHTAGHDQTASWVRDGAVALGVANCSILQSMFDEGRLTGTEIRVLDTTPPYPDYVWATTASLDERTRLSILDAFLALDPTNPEHRAVLRSQGANAYYPAGVRDFEMIHNAAHEAGFLKPVEHH